MHSGVHAGYRPEIDGLRAVAVLAVIAYYLNGAWLPSGYVGVDVFFVISGFVVTAFLSTLFQKDGRPLFFDGDHLSAYGNSVVYPAFKKAILEAW